MAVLKGVNEVMINLNKEVQAIKGRTMAGMIEAIRFIRVDMDQTPPLIPVDTGNLRSSWFVTPVPDPSKPSVIFGFGANYAIFVHEMLGSKKGKPINWKRPGSGAKFLESAMKRNTDKILQIIASNVKIK